MLVDRERLIVAMRNAYLQFLKIQDRMVLKMTTRYSKVEVIQNFWDKLLGQIHLKASEFKDEAVIKLCGDLILVKPEIKDEMLK